MPTSKPLKHLVIVLPGIMGSVLRHRDGRDVWALSGGALLEFLKSNSASLRTLQIAQDDPDAPDLGDGIYADRLIGDIYNIPGLIDGAGYSVLVRRTLAGLGGRLIEGNIHTPDPGANFFPFPYDWRRDNRASAAALKRFVDRQLPAWRAHSGNKGAEVIFLAHSMGGLVARYYVEWLGGWEHTRRLITFGTPHRGSLNALDVLSNGFRISGGGFKGVLIGLVQWKYPELFADLTRMVRSFPSVYQLLPYGEVLQTGSAFATIHQTDGIPELSRERAAAALSDFHQPIIDANARNQADSRYRNPTLPVVGVGQNTFQSAYLANGRVELSLLPPAALDPDLADGDGTVPRFSAVPRELDGADQEVLLPEHHGWLTNVDAYLDTLPAALRSLAAGRPGNKLADDLLAARRVSLHVDQLYLAGEPITVEVEMKDDGPPPALRLLVEPVDAAAAPVSLPVSFAERPKAEITIAPEQAPAGLYRVRVEGVDARRAAAIANTTFEVVE